MGDKPVLFSFRYPAPLRLCFSCPRPSYSPSQCFNASRRFYFNPYPLPEEAVYSVRVLGSKGGLSFRRKFGLLEVFDVLFIMCSVILVFFLPEEFFFPPFSVFYSTLCSLYPDEGFFSSHPSSDVLGLVVPVQGSDLRALIFSSPSGD